LLHDPDFIATHRTVPKAFSRQRLLTFPVLVAFLLCAWKGGLQTLLDELFESLTGQAGRVATKSAVSQARRKLKASAFEALNDRLLPSLNEHWPESRWRGLRLVAADATTLRLPNNPQTQAEFGIQADPTGQPFVMARALGLYSTASGRMLKAALAGYKAAERELLVPLLPSLNQDDLLILDRGFPAVWLFALLQQQGLHFLARIDGGQWPEVEAFAKSGLMEQTVTRPVGRDTRRSARALGVESLPDQATFRLVRVCLPNGNEQILATSLTDGETYPTADFAELYHARWGIEEAFKLLKHRLLIEQFSGESPEAIRQDFHAKIFTANLAEAMAHSAHQHLPDEKAARYQPNLTYAIARLRLRLFGWLIKRATPDDVLSILTLIGKTLERKRPGRCTPRPKSRPNPRPRRQYK
jgi:Transposase DDE domain